MSGNAHQIGVNKVTKAYHSPRISSEFCDCSLPLTFDHYSKCGFGCQYCFSAQFSKSNPAVKGRNDLGAVKIEKLIDIMSGKYPDNPYYQNFFKHRFILHWGGLTEPFCSIESEVGEGYKLLEYLADVKYPTVFSSKGYCLFLGNKKHKHYEKLFADNAKYKNFMFAHSIIVDSDATASKIEPNTPSTTDRIRSMKTLSDMGYWNILRLRPFMIGISDVGLENMMHRCADAGAKAISTEFFALDNRCVALLDENMKEIDKITGFNTFDYLKKLSPTERGGYMRGNRDAKESFVKRLYKTCLETGMQFNISDPDYKELNMSDSCCGLPEKYPENPEMENYTRGQLTGHLRRLRRRYWQSGGTDKILTFDMVEKDIANNWMSDPRYYGDSIKCWQIDYGIKTGHKKELMNTWNNLRSAACPYNYFHGKIKPIGKDERDMLIYEYVPHPYEYRWQKEGIDLTQE